MVMGNVVEGFGGSVPYGPKDIAYGFPLGVDSREEEEEQQEQGGDG